jgi:hypothetical protein
VASLSLTNQEIKQNLAAILGITRTIADWDSTLAADVDRIIRNGRRRFYSSHDWRFLRVHTSFLTSAAQTTGTVTVASGVVTLVGATFPATVINNYLFESPDGFFEVASRDSDTQITLLDTSANADAAAGSTYGLHQYRFDLPSNFGGFVGPVQLENNDVLRSYAVIPDFELRTFHNRTAAETGKPKGYAVSSRLADEDLSVPTYYLTIYPLADAAYRIEADIKLVPGDTLDDTDATVNGHPAFAAAVSEAIYAEAEVFMGSFEGVHAALYEQRLVEAKRIDAAMAGSRRLLFRNRGREMRDNLYYLRTGSSVWPGE